MVIDEPHRFGAPVSVVGDDERARSHVFLEQRQDGWVEALGVVEQREIDLVGEVTSERLQSVAIAKLDHRPVRR